MFSEYASRFLAQSQSRLSPNQGDQIPQQRPTDRYQTRSAQPPSRGYLPRRPFGATPASDSQSSRFPFASRFSNAPAPLFYSATDDLRDDDDVAQHEREIADYQALQRSRRDFGAERLSNSHEEPDTRRDRRFPRFGRAGALGRMPNRTFNAARDIRSSWNGDDDDDRQDSTRNQFSQRVQDSMMSSGMAKSKGKLVDVNLNSTIHEADEPEDLFRQSDDDENPPSLQTFRKPPRDHDMYPMSDSQNSTSRPNDAPNLSVASAAYRASSLDRGSSIPSTTQPENTTKQNNYDTFWSALFVIDMIAMFSTFFLVVLHTSSPSDTSYYGDTVYTALRSSFHLLGVDTVVAIVVALIWLAALRNFVRPLVLLILAAVPIIAISFSLYPFISSFKGARHGQTLQDKAMRYMSFVPGAFALIWTYTAYRARHSLDRAIELLAFATRILAACPTLVFVGFATLALVVSWTWLWMLMFTRVFLGGHLASTGSGTATLFIINTSTWFLGTFFVLSYLWSLGVISGIQRATNAAATSQWYFYRDAIPAPSAQSVVQAALSHACGRIFGSICFASLLTLGVRLPLLLLPGRIAQGISLCFYSFVPASIATLTNPLTLTYAAIHSQSLTSSARNLSELVFVGRTTRNPTNTLTPRGFSHRHSFDPNGAPSLMAYRLSKLLLHATRLVTSLALAFGGWVSTARMLPISTHSDKQPTTRGSLYAYVVALVAGAIGWAVLGAMEGVLGGVLDAVVVCWGSEMQSHAIENGGAGAGEAKFCREAGELLGKESETTGWQGMSPSDGHALGRGEIRV